MTLQSEWVNLIKTTDQQKPFRIAFVEHPLTDDMLPADTPVITNMNSKDAYEPIVKALTGIARVWFQLKNTVTSQIAMAADCTTSCHLEKSNEDGESHQPYHLRRAYPPVNFLAIKDAKYNDVKALLTQVHPDARVTFCDKLEPYGAAIANRDDDDDDDDREQSTEIIFFIWL